MKRCVIAVFAMYALDAGAQESILSADSLGEIAFGSKLRQVEGLLNQTAKPRDGYGDESCRYVSFESLPGSLFMVENGTVTRIEAAPTIRNTLNISVGTRMDEVLKAHPDAQVIPHQYDPEGHYLIFPSKDNTAAIVMEVGDGTVTDIRAGLRPSVDYVEGCL